MLAVAAGGPSSIPACRCCAGAGRRHAHSRQRSPASADQARHPSFGRPLTSARRSDAAFDGHPIAGVKYFMASTCPPAAFERLKGHDVVLWQPDVADGPSAGAIVRGGYTIGLLCLALGDMLGFRDIHFHGGDSSFEPAGSFHAYRSVADSLGRNEMIVHCADRTFATTPELLGQALAFPHLRERLAANQTTLTVHGHGLAALPRDLQTPRRHRARCSDHPQSRHAAGPGRCRRDRCPDVLSRSPLRTSVAAGGYRRGSAPEILARG